MVGGSVQGVEAVGFVLDLGPIGDGEADFTEGSDDILGGLSEGVESAEVGLAAWGGEVGGLFGEGGLEGEVGSALAEEVFQFRFGGIDGFAGGWAFLFGEGAQLFHEGGELSIGADPGAFGAFEGGDIGCGLEFQGGGLLEGVEIGEQRGHGVVVWCGFRFLG